MMSSAMPTNVEMAEQGVRELYLLVKGREPDGIVWCSSPRQMSLERMRATAESRNIKPTSMAADRDFSKHIIKAGFAVERAAGIKMDADAIMVAAGASLMGVWDKRLALQFLPFAETKMDALTQKLVQDTSQKFLRFNATAVYLQAWFSNLFPLFPAATNRSLQLFTRSFWCVPYAIPWLPFALACRFIDPSLMSEVDREIDCWGYLAHGAFAYCFTDNVCFVCPKPTTLHLNDAGQPHNENGPAVAWADGFEVYAWRGTVVKPNLIIKRKALTAKRIHRTRNAEMRRVMIEIYGQSRYLIDARAHLIHEDQTGVLYRLHFRDDEPLVMVKVKNSTPEPDGTFKYYFLRVPPEVQTAKEAVAWTFALDEREYSPSIET